jgi:hypothetical protein
MGWGILHYQKCTKWKCFLNFSSYYMKTERQNYIQEKNTKFRRILSRNHVVTERISNTVDCCSQTDTVPLILSVLLYSTFTLQTVQSTTELYLQYLPRNCSYMFSCTTTQHIYCTNTVQTVHSTTEQYLQQLHTTCCYMICRTQTAHQISSQGECIVWL